MGGMGARCELGCDFVDSCVGRYQIFSAISPHENVCLVLNRLDWVSKDASSYSYPKTLYPGGSSPLLLYIQHTNNSHVLDQAAFDPYNADAGNGQFSNGSWVTPPDPSTVYAAWNVTAAKTYLSGLTNKPQVVTIDNEIEIASNTHQDMHPE